MRSQAIQVGMRPALAVAYPHPGGAGACFAAWVQDQYRDSPGEQQHMRSWKAAKANADVEARIAQIEQMTLDEMATWLILRWEELRQEKPAPWIALSEKGCK
jgi:hypothetical protein